MNQAKKISLMVVVILALFLTNLHVFAQEKVTGGGTTKQETVTGGGTTKPVPIIKLDNPIKAKSIQDLLFSLVDFAIFLGSIVAVFMFMYIGFKFVAAQGNESEIKSAKEWFTYAVIGTAILLSSKVIVEVMKNTLIDTGLVNKEVFTQIK